MTLIHELSANEKFGQNKHCRHYVHSTYAIGPLWSHILRGWKRCHALLEREIWQIVAYPPSFLMSNTVPICPWNAPFFDWGWLPSWRILWFDVIMSDGELHRRKMKLLGGERDADERRHNLTALHVAPESYHVWFGSAAATTECIFESSWLAKAWWRIVKQDQGVELIIEIFGSLSYQLPEVDRNV